MKIAPVQWSGSARHLIEEVLRPHFISPEYVRAWHQFLEKKMREPNATFMVQAFASEQRFRWGQEQPFLTLEGSKIRFGDNSPAAAVFSFLLDAPSDHAEKMAGLYLHLPHHSFDLDKFTRWSGQTNNVASAGWMVSHLRPGITAGPNWENLSRRELERMTIRNLHALNLFLFPNLKKSGAIFADDPRFHALMAEAYHRHYGTLWDSFVELAGIESASQTPADDFEIDLSGAHPLPQKLQIRDLISKIEAKDAFDLKLVSVTEAQGYQSRLLETSALSRGLMDIKLEFKDKDGQTKTVGYYRLNIKDLYDKKFLPRDAKGVRLLIYRMEDLDFAVAPKRSGPYSALPV